MVDATDVIRVGADLLGIKSDSDANKDNIRFQREFARRGIRYKVNDAKKAGIHPLYALGASTNMPSYNIRGQGDMIRNAGQSMSRMFDKNAKQLEALQKKSIEADITLKMARASEVAKRTQKLNSQQDMDLVALDNPVPNKKLHSQRKPIETIIGTLLPSKNPGYIDADKIPERYGDEAKDVLGLIALWNDYWRDSGANMASTSVGKAIYNFKEWLSKDRRNKRKPKVTTPYMR